MIFNRPLTFEEKKSSRHNYSLYNIVNGASYMCLGETVLILLAVQLKCSDTVVAILGSMQYVGFLLLPLGKIMTARTGAAGSQAQFWVYRNLAVLIVAAAVPASLWISKELAVILLLSGAFLFYGFRAAGVVMSQPLIGEICESASRGQFISSSAGLFYLTGSLALIVITLLMRISSSIWILFLVIVAGAALGITSSRFIRNIHETDRIQRSAREPVWNKLGKVLKLQVIRRQIIAGMIGYLGYMLTIPLSMLALKRGFCVSDTNALFFALIQFGAAAGAGFLQGKIADRYGARKMLIAAYGCFLIVSLLWALSPDRLLPFYHVLIFLIGAYGYIGTGNALAQYYLETVPLKLQIVSSIVISISTGVFSGLLSMGIASVLLKLAAVLNSGEQPFTTYRIYFLMLVCLLPVLGLLVWRLPDASKKHSGK